MPVKNAPADVTKPEFKAPPDHTEPEPTPAPTPKSDDVSRSDVAPSETSKPDVATRKDETEDKPQSYVWLANGTVKRCYNEDLPATGGGDFGHWNEGDKVHTIVAVYPVEETVKG